MIGQTITLIRSKKIACCHSYTTSDAESPCFARKFQLIEFLWTFLESPFLSSVIAFLPVRGGHMCDFHRVLTMRHWGISHLHLKEDLSLTEQKIVCEIESQVNLGQGQLKRNMLISFLAQPITNKRAIRRMKTQTATDFFFQFI